MTHEWTLIPGKLLQPWAHQRFDGETLENIAVFITIHYFSPLQICFHFNCFVLNLDGHSVLVFTSNEMRFDDNFRSEWKFTVWVMWCFSARETKKTIQYCAFAVRFFAWVEICLTLETCNKWTLSLEMAVPILWFFVQSEAKKIEKKMKLN